MPFTIQKGFQQNAFKCPAYMALWATGSGVGKTHLVAADFIDKSDDPNFVGAYYMTRKDQLKGPGSFWETFKKILDADGYEYVRNKNDMTVEFPSGAKIHCRHVNTNSRKILNVGREGEEARGLQITALYIDEASIFPEDNFRFLMTRVRTSSTKTKPYIRILTNPDVGWVKEMAQYFIDELGRPIKEKCSKIHYLGYVHGKPVVRPDKQDFAKEFGWKQKELIGLLTFAMHYGTIWENKIFLKENPKYLASLMSGSPERIDRFLHGYWSELPDHGLFNREHFLEYSGFPEYPEKGIITIDTAVSIKPGSDFTVASVWAFKGDSLYLVDMARGRWRYQDMKHHLFGLLRKHIDLVDEVHIETYNTGAILIDEMSEEFHDKSFYAIRRNSHISKVVRAQRAASFFHKIKVFLPADEEEIRNEFLREVTAFDQHCKHVYDDICDTFFDAIDRLKLHISNKFPESSQTTNNLNQIPMIGSHI